MKILFFSDVHGSATAFGNLVLHIADLKPDLLVSCGDALYHGPRNSLPQIYDTKKVATMMNVYKNKIMAVRGNCDCEVDQLMLQFPMMGDYTTLFVDGTQFFVTHGHIWSFDNPPQLPDRSVFVQGHTHIPALEIRNGLVMMNPGSISLPKADFPGTFGLLDGRELSILSIENRSPILPSLIIPNHSL